MRTIKNFYKNFSIDFKAQNFDSSIYSLTKTMTTTTSGPISSTILNSLCQCMCSSKGEAIVPPSCGKEEQIDCRCRIKAIKTGVCATGYTYSFKGICYGKLLKNCLKKETS